MAGTMDRDTVDELFDEVDADHNQEVSLTSCMLPLTPYIFDDVGAYHNQKAVRLASDI